MIKTVGLMPRRADIAREAFRDHYETRHAPLALTYFPFAKYVRNHIVHSDPDPVGFDCLSEFWVEDVGEIHALMESEIGDIMREDERRFTDQARIGPAVAEEIHVFGPPRIVEDGPVAKEALLLRRSDGRAAGDFAPVLADWAAALAAASGGGLTRVTLDLVTPFENRHFPDCHAILYGWTAQPGGALFGSVLPDGIEIEARLRVEAMETRFS